MEVGAYDLSGTQIMTVHPVIQLLTRSAALPPTSCRRKKRESKTPFLLQLLQQLLVVDVHGDFEAKTNVTVFWSFPFHVNSPHIVSYKIPGLNRDTKFDVHFKCISNHAKFFYS